MLTSGFSHVAALRCLAHNTRFESLNPPTVACGVQKGVHGRGRPKPKLFEVGIAVKRLISIHSLAWIVAVAGTFAVTPAWAELKIGVVRALIERYYEGHPPEKKRAALEQLAALRSAK